MRVLIVSQLAPYLPCHDGFRTDVAHLVTRLVPRHDVALVAIAGPGDGEAARQWAASFASPCVILPPARWRNPLTGATAAGLDAVGAATEDVIRRFRPDVLHLEGPVLGPLVRTAGIPTVLAAHGSRALRARDLRRIAQSPVDWGAAWLSERVERRWEREWFPRADACVVPSHEDRAAVIDAVPVARVDVIPGGIDTRRYPYRHAARPDRVVFTGNLSWAPDVDAAQRLAARIMPRVRHLRPRAELIVAGTTPVPAVRALARLPGVRVTAPVADVRLIVAAAAVFASPVRAGFGPKLPVLEAMALGAPVVATPRSVAGPDVIAGHHALVGEDDEALAQAIVAVLEQPVLANTLARNAREMVECRHEWSGVALAWEAVYARILGRETGLTGRGVPMATAV